MGEHECSGPPAVEGRRLIPFVHPDNLLTMHSETPPMPAPSLFERFNPWGAPAAPKDQSRAPPQVDTSAASTLDASRTMANADDGSDRAYAGQGQLTPVSSLSSGSQPSEQNISPKTPNARPATDKPDEFFAPQIANDSPPPQPTRRSGGYGGLGNGTDFDDQLPPSNPARKQSPPNLMERLNSIAPGPFDANRRPSSSARSDINDRPGTSASNLGSLGGGQAQPSLRKNGYGGFGVPARSPSRQEDNPPPLTPSRADTFPRPNEGFPPPQRTPSAPPAALRIQPPDRLRAPSESFSDRDGGTSPDSRGSMMSDRPRRPSRGPDTSRPPPPRSATLRPTTPGLPTINLAEEFGVGNPYHTPSESTGSSVSVHSMSVQSVSAQSSFERRPSQASSRTSPPRSIASRSGRRKPSDTSSFDNLMSDLQSTMDDNQQKPPGPASLKMPYKGGRDRPSPLSARPPPPEGGYDPRIDPRGQRRAAGGSPLPSPLEISPLGESPAIMTPSILTPGSGAQPSPGWPTPKPEPARPREQEPPVPQQSALRELQGASPMDRSQGPQRAPPMEAPRELQRAPTMEASKETQRPPVEPFRPQLQRAPTMEVPRQLQRAATMDEPRDMQRQDPSRTPQRPRDPRDELRDGRPLHERSRSQPRNLPPPSAQPSRGDCKACGLPIKGKSISSADGRLTGRYHKPCFVCSTCQEPFTSATFYVLNDRPYCEQHYHKLNGSLCGSCGRGIEGEYLEDETSRKHHVGCFKCGDCGMALRDGYFEVNGRAFCEKDAWRRVQQPPPPPMMMGGGRGMGGPPGRGRGGMRPPGPMGLPGANPRFGPNGPYGNSRLGPGPRPKMEKRMTRLGML
ncbi:uncharacterized protein PODANS_2_1720 [Podospora anserina S mat+]|uniref:Podospora anserina S mat+ genomic DNA chromosome 2, supercontig 2 n=1 Tax=Podospora anserina (strain S / ATCC MYA-4624 / DSM 980 / FGSC 10383) TaxID=515849 RepID=B2B4L8_PODAN|nr:uncharacterized protein PODANS_2_1720 [Podospora anserina S mat+]CAP72743.1 unnamed protein product [Podospora anserina S mat+]CDP25140.1 Putative protein of unknown function [Podospora anserina S mat+]